MSWLNVGPIRRLPSPVVELYAKAADEALPIKDRREAMLKAPEQLLRIACLPLLVTFLRQRQHHDKLADVLANFAKPTYGIWKWLFDVLRGAASDMEWGPLGDYVTRLDQAAKAIKKLRATSRAEYAYGIPGHQVPLLELFQGIRNHWAHSISISKDLLESDLRDFFPHLTTLLEEFAFLTEFRICSRLDDTHILEHHGVRPEVLEVQHHPVPEDQVFLRTPQREWIRLSPFLLPAPFGEEGVYLFDGYRLNPGRSDPNDAIVYQTNRGSTLLEPNASELRSLLEKHKVVLLRGLGEGITLANLGNFISGLTKRHLEEMQARYSEELFIDRPVLTGALHAFATESRSENSAVAILLFGATGSGKSGLITNLARQLLRDRGSCDGVLLIRGDRLTVDAGVSDVLFSNLLLTLGIDRKKFGNIIQLLQEFDRGRGEGNQEFRLVFLFDGVNEVPTRPERVFQELLEFIAASRPYPWIRVVAAVRQEFLLSIRAGLSGVQKDFLHGVRHLFATPGPEVTTEFCNGEGFPVWVVPSATPDERRSMYERYQALNQVSPGACPACLTRWEDVDAEIRDKILDRPLLIRLWMELYNGKQASRLHRVSDLYIAYLDSLRDTMPDLTRRALPCIVEYMLQLGRSVLTEEDIIDQPGQAATAVRQSLEALVQAGLFEVRVPYVGAMRYNVFHQRMAEALAARWLRESVAYPSGGFPPEQHRKLQHAELSNWDRFPCHSLNPLLIGGLELFVRHLLDLGDWTNAARVLEHVDFQMPPNSSWLFLAGRVGLSVEFREELDKHLSDQEMKQQNLYQLALGYIRLGRHGEADKALTEAEGLGGRGQMRAAIATYAGLLLIRCGELEKGHQRLLESLALAKGTRIEGNVCGHLASSKIKMLRGSNPPPELIDEVIGLYQLAVCLNTEGGRPDPRAEVYWRTELGRAHLTFNQTALAVDVLDDAWNRCIRAGLDTKCRLDLHHALGQAYRLEGWTNRAREELQAGLQLAIEMGDGELRQELEKEMGTFGKGEADFGL